MSKKPLVSIVMPVYNAMPYLEQAVQSIYAQTLTDWELIAVDDYSTDGSWEYLQNIDDPRVQLARNDKNMRQSYTQNRGIDLACGKYIARMDADDLSLPLRLEKQIKALKADPDIDVLGCGSFRTNQNLGILTVIRHPTTHKEVMGIVSFDLRFFYGANFKITHGTMVGKTGWFRRWKADPSVQVVQDFDMVCRAQRHTTFANVPEPLYVYREGSGKASSLIAQIKKVNYKAISLLKHGFHRGTIQRSLLGLMALVPRPLTYAAIHLIVHNKKWGKKIPFVELGPKDIKTLQNGLAEIAKAKVPLKKLP